MIAWNSTIAQYVEDGMPIDDSLLYAVLEESIGYSQGYARSLAQLVSDGFMPPQAWEDAFLDELKREYLRAWVLGRGGLSQVEDDDYEEVGEMLDEQFAFLVGFTAAVAMGNLSEGVIAARSAMYFNSAREPFERSRMVVSSQIYSEVLWVLDPFCEHCPDCPELAALGWQSLDDNPFDGCVPGSGCTVCMTNCCCHLEYR